MKHTVTVNIAGISYKVQTDADAVTINDVKFVFIPTLPVETKKTEKLICQFTYRGEGLERITAVQYASDLNTRAMARKIVHNNLPFQVDEENVEVFEQFCADNHIEISYLPTT